MRRHGRRESGCDPGSPGGEQEVGVVQPALTVVNSILPTRMCWKAVGCIAMRESGNAMTPASCLQPSKAESPTVSSREFGPNVMPATLVLKKAPASIVMRESGNATAPASCLQSMKAESPTVWSRT